MPSKLPILPISMAAEKKQSFAQVAKLYNRSMSSIINEFVDSLLNPQPASSKQSEQGYITPRSKIDVRSIVVDVDREKMQGMIDHSLSVYSAQQAELADDVDIYDFINEQVRKSMHRHRLTVEFSEQINTSIACTVKQMMTHDGEIQEMVAEMITGEWDGSIPILNSVEVAALLDERIELVNSLWFEAHCRIELIEGVILAGGDD